MIIGLTGLSGAGKSTVAEYLATHHGFSHFSVRGYLATKLKEKDLPVNRDTMRLIANQMREQHGPGYISRQLMGDILTTSPGDVVVESLRSIGETRYLKSFGAIIWAIEADEYTRYRRTKERGFNTDNVSFKEFLTHEFHEHSNSETTKQNIASVIAMADSMLYNDNSKQELFMQIEGILHGR